MNRNLNLIIGVFIATIVIMLSGNVIIIGDKIGQITHVYVEYLFYAVLLILGYIYIIRPIVKMHLSPEFPTLRVDENWNRNELYAFAKKLRDNCSYISDKEIRKSHRDYLDEHIRHNCAQTENLKLIITNEVDRRINGDTDLRVAGVDSRIKEWAKSVFIVTAVSQNSLFDTLSVLILNYRMIADIILASGFKPTKSQLFKLYVRILSTALFTYFTSHVFSNNGDLMPFNFTDAEDLASAAESELEDVDMSNVDMGDLEASDAGFGNTIIQRIKTIKVPGLLIDSAAQGCINALLTLRIGFVTKAYLLEGPKAITGLKNKRKTKRAAMKSAFKAMPGVIIAGGTAIGATVAKALAKVFKKEWNEEL